MKNDEKTYDRNKNLQKIWELYKEEHGTEEYYLKEIVEIYLPFWKCKQSIVIEKELELNRFSRVLLELIQEGLNTHKELCLFLGIDEDSFATVQLHFLLTQGLICESENGSYDLTYQGRDFLDKKKKIKNIETTDFEFYVTEKLDFLQNDLIQTFFDPNLPIDSNRSDKKKQSFSGYRIMQTHKLNIPEDAKTINHSRKNKPTFNKISSNRSKFSSFFNSINKEGVFYDFAEPVMDTHKRSICFYGLLYEHKVNKEDILVDIRRSRKTVNTSNNLYNLEELLSKKVTAHFRKHGWNESR